MRNQKYLANRARNKSIAERVRAGETYESLGNEFGKSPKAIYLIYYRETYP